MSGVTVATIITSSSVAATPRFSRHFFAASTARSLAATPLSTRCRSRIPVRSRIHSFVRRHHLFQILGWVSKRGGTYVPTALILARNRNPGASASNSNFHLTAMLQHTKFHL